MSKAKRAAVRARSRSYRGLSARVTSLALPPDVNEASYRAAVDLDRLFAKGRYTARDFRMKVRTHKDKLFHHAGPVLDGKPPILNVGWPSFLYIPGAADYRTHWFAPPPDDHRYAHDWAPPTPPPGFSEASRDNGWLYCFQRIRTIDTYAQAEAGLGVLFTPKATLSVISLEPYIICSGEHRWFAEFNQPVAGETRVNMSVILAAWQQIPGPAGWDLLGQKQFQVQSAGPNSGIGQQAITPYKLSFTGPYLATPFMVQSGRTYRLGIVARVSVWSTLTDDRGRRLPLIEDGTFRVWGNLGVLVPHIEVWQKQVYIP